MKENYDILLEVFILLKNIIIHAILVKLEHVHGRFVGDILPVLDILLEFRCETQESSLCNFVEIPCQFLELGLNENIRREEEENVVQSFIQQSLDLVSD